MRWRSAGPPPPRRLTIGDTNTASGPSPFAPGCGGPGEAFASSVNYLNAEVESHLADDPTDADTLAGAWQQDRWNDGGAHGNVHAFSTDGGETWTVSSPRFSRCAGGTATSAVQATTGAPRPSDYQRATDPWVSYGPDGRLHAIALVFDNSTPRNAVLTAFSDNDGATWSAPREVRFDNPRALGNNFNDKETLTADPGDADLVYATWQRIVSPSERASGTAYENSVSYFSDAWFARSTDGGVTWEPARSIFHPGRFQQTIGNQIEVLPERHADQRVQPDPGGQQPQQAARLQRRGAAVDRQGRDLVGAGARRTACWSTRSRTRTWPRPAPTVTTTAAATCGPATSSRTSPSTGARTWPRAATSTRSGWTPGSTTPTTTTSCCRARPTGAAAGTRPVVVDHTPEGVDAFTATVDVDGTGRVAVSYYDFRNDELGDAELSTDFWVAHSHDGGATFPDEDRLTAESFDMRTAPFALGYFVGDYTGLSHFGDRFDSLWVGANDGDLVNRTDAFHQSAE